MGRQTGFTSRQIRESPAGAVYVWVGSDIRYPKELAKALHREDLLFVGPSWLETQGWRGRVLNGITIDHAADLTDYHWGCFMEAYRYMKRRQ